ncbi:NAD-dependent epimerase/dehydratase family protein [Butyrivibrio fibrisolvens]|uniref:NAD-dependent epimerase/dehydratase family protein n=1 Tax=Butyrivibrio fibrisolvens TaxID=831 RepID=UPI00040D9318|nr:NAD-dependent epimerase/dehydratase family protein [Butyrivibrio fibrisolvens]
MKKALVTGANGFVGAAVCKQLALKNYEVIAVIRNQASDISRLAGIPDIRMVYCDLSDIKNLHHVIADRDVDYTYHFAWTGSSGSLRSNYHVQTDCVKYTCDVVKACSEIGCKRFIFAGSIMEYEIQNAVKNEGKLSANTVYSSAKLAADNMARAISNDLGVEYICGIISNIYGPGEKSPRLVNSTIRKLLKGEHCKFSSGEQLYDFIYIDDAARAFTVIGEKGTNNRSYYIGTNPRKLKEYLQMIKDVINPDILLGFGELPDPITTLSYSEFDVCALENEFDFDSNISFKEGIEATVRYIKENIYEQT